MTDLEKFTSILDNQKDDSYPMYNRCDSYEVDNHLVSRVIIEADDVEFVFDFQGRFLGIENRRE